MSESSQYLLRFVDDVCVCSPDTLVLARASVSRTGLYVPLLDVLIAMRQDVRVRTDVGFVRQMYALRDALVAALRDVLAARRDGVFLLATPWSQAAATVGGDARDVLLAADRHVCGVLALVAIVSVCPVEAGVEVAVQELGVLRAVFDQYLGLVGAAADGQGQMVLDGLFHALTAGAFAEAAALVAQVRRDLSQWGAVR